MRAIIDKYAGLPFDYRSDCCRFAGECVEANTGKNPIADLTYTTKREAGRLIEKFGSLKAAVTHYLGEPLGKVSPKTGDICLIDANDGTEAVGVIYRDRVVARVKNGLMDYPLSRALVLWEAEPCRR